MLSVYNLAVVMVHVACRMVHVACRVAHGACRVAHGAWRIGLKAVRTDTRSFASFAIFVVLTALVHAALSVPCFAEDLMVEQNGARTPIALDAQGRIDAAHLPQPLASRVSYDPLTRIVQIDGDLSRWRFVAGQRWADQAGSFKTLDRPVDVSAGKILMPASVVDLFGELFSFVSIAHAENGGRAIVVKSFPAAPSPNIRRGETREAAGKAGQIRVIVIDPGHGGSDPGARETGIAEKDIILPIALELARVLQARDHSLKVFLTRKTDEFISLKDRVAFSNRHSADMFISLHANSARRNRKANGFEVYYLDMKGGDDEARVVAAIENSVDESLSADAGRDDPLKAILGDMTQVSYRDDSERLARFLASSMGTSLEETRNRGIKGAFFHVLKGAMAPSALVETGFITNHWEASFLSKPWYQSKIANALADGVLNFKSYQQSRLSGGATTDGEGSDAGATGP